MKELKYLFKFYKKYRWRFALGTFFVVTSNIFALYPAIYTRKAFDAAKEAIESSQTSNYDFSELTSTLLYFGMMLILFALLKGVFMFFMRQTIIVMSRLIEFDIKNEIFKHYQNLDRAFYKRNNTGDMMARISEDVTKVRMFLGPATMYPINMISLFLFVMYNMFSINVKLSLFVLAPLPLMSITIFFISKVIHAKSEKVQTQLSTLSTLTQESFSGIRILKSFVNEKTNFNIFKTETNEYLKRNVSLAKTNAAFFPFMLLLIGLSTLLTIYIGGKESIAGNISTGNIAEFIIYVNMLTWPMASIGWVTSIIQRAAASQKRINEFLNTKANINSTDGNTHEIQGRISFKNISFEYPDSEIKALNNISFDIDKGESIAIVGRTGSGKSTIINLISRMYKPTSGRIEIDGIPIEKINLKSLRSGISLVPQEALLFSDTISNNIAFGSKEELTQQTIEAVAEKAAIHDNIKGFPKGYQTIVGERGVTLSGGQKQRISIARALIRPSSILIFDDCLSAVDNETEEKILASIKKEGVKKTTITISHRISSIQHVDKIIVLNNGQIAEMGTHKNLFEKRGIYFEMYQQQLSK
ncbi:MAG: ABC transporter ATP-binding protein [Flavobacteriales bacterium]|jgi:ATP-binding cassette subfamily B protein|nr:ABC transporter ATP-binding protein [Flavobacteriales bacterium]